MFSVHLMLHLFYKYSRTSLLLYVHGNDANYYHVRERRRGKTPEKKNSALPSKRKVIFQPTCF